MERVNLPAAALAFFLVLAPGCGEQRRVDRELEGDPDRKQTAEEKKAIEFLKSKGANFRWSDAKTRTTPPIEPFWSVFLHAQASDADVEHLKQIKSLKHVGIGGNVTDQGVAALAEL